MQPGQSFQPAPAPQASDDGSQPLPHISDVKINGPDAHMSATLDDRPVGHGPVAGAGRREGSKGRGPRFDDGVSSDAPVLEVNGGHRRAHIVDGDGKDLWQDADAPKQKQDGHELRTDDRDFLDEWDKEAHGESAPRLSSDEELEAELGEDALDASGVQKVGGVHEDAPKDPPKDPHDRDEPIGFPATGVDVRGEPPQELREPREVHEPQEPGHETAVSDNLDSEDYGELVWRQVTEYANEHGIKLSGPDTREIVDRVLKDDGVTWEQARDMPISDHVEFNPAIFDDYR